MPDINFNTSPTRNTKNLCGQQFERLLVIGFVGTLSHGRNARAAAWLCQCTCGQWKNIKGHDLRSGNIRSCGCLQQESRILSQRRHGASETREYAAFLSARRRCNAPKEAQYPNYGGRGVKFCFETFEEFFAELGQRPSRQYSVDRIDVNGHYEVGNVKWATAREQALNRRSARMLTMGEDTKHESEWAELYRIGNSTISARRRKGWCTECSITIPPNTGRCTHKS